MKYELTPAHTSTDTTNNVTTTTSPRKNVTLMYHRIIPRPSLIFECHPQKIETQGKNKSMDCTRPCDVRHPGVHTVLGLPGTTLPVAPVLPVDREHPPRTLPHRSGTGSRRTVLPRPHVADIVSTGDTAARSGTSTGSTSTAAAAACDACRSYSRCGGVSGRGKRPVS